MRSFPIDFVRQFIEQSLLEEKIKEPNKYFGGDSQVKLFSFYEQLQKDDEVDRYVNIYRDLTEQQNRTGLIMNGTIIAPENPTITNVNQCLIIPMSFTNSFRVKLGDRDKALETINNLISVYKGRHIDIAELNNGQLFKVGTIANNVNGNPHIKCGDYLGNLTSSTPTISQLTELLKEVLDKGIENELNDNDYVYFSGLNKLCVALYTRNFEITLTNFAIDDFDYETSLTGRTIVTGTISFQSTSTYQNIPDIETFEAKLNIRDSDRADTKDVNCEINSLSKNESNYLVGTATFKFSINSNQWDLNTFDISFNQVLEQPLTYGLEVINDEKDYPNVVFPPEHETFTKYKLSVSFDSIRCDEPRNLNAEEYCVISFGGSATLVSKNVYLGNDLTKIGVKKTLIKASTDISISDSNHWLEPLELPSSNNANTQVSQLLSNKFLSNSHTDSLAISMQYTFIADKSVDLIKQWFDYARYGKQADGTNVAYTNGITPNMIYEITEIWSSWGEVEVNTFKAKIVESIDIENTESDTLTITIPFQVQGDNN